MTKLDHLKTTKTYLKKVVAYRRNLIRLNYGKSASASMVKTMAEIDYYMGIIKSFDRMMNYISQEGVRDRINELIPVNKPKWREELEQLVKKGQVLQGKVVSIKQTEINL